MQKYLGDLYRLSAPDSFPYWKHSLPPDYYAYPDGVGNPVPISPGDFPDVLFVCMARSPYFWAISCCKRPYDLVFQSLFQDLGSCLRCPVVFRRKRRFPNIIQLWNRYYRAYETHLDFSQVVTVRLEDLVRTPLDVIRRLDQVLERKPGCKPEWISEKLSATPMMPLNSFGDLWEERNRTQHLLGTIPNHDLAFIDNQLDHELMRHFDYPLVWATPQMG